MKKFNSPLEAFLHWEENSPNKLFLKQHDHGKSESLSYLESGKQIRKLAQAIKNKNLPDQSKIALLSKNCSHWIMADLAIMMSGHISVPIYPTLNAESIKPVIEHSESKLIIIGKLDNYKTQEAAFQNLPKISVDKYGIQEGESWETLVGSNEELKEVALPEPKNLISIIYTSGTTGMP